MIFPRHFQNSTINSSAVYMDMIISNTVLLILVFSTSGPRTSRTHLFDIALDFSFYVSKLLHTHEGIR